MPHLSRNTDIPSTSFSCVNRPRGYYADNETNCRVFHMCYGEGDIKWSFFCPNQTIFNEQHLVCDYAFNVDCPSAEARRLQVP